MIAGHSSKTNPAAKAPKFIPEIIFSKWERDFKAFIRRIPECDFILNNKVKPIKPNDKTNKKKMSKWENNSNLWTRGNATLYSHLYEAVLDHTRAYVVVCGFDPNGIEALEALAKEFESNDVLKEQAIDLRAEFDNKKIGKGETITQWISILNNYRLRLKNLGIEISDEDMANKIKTSMVSDDNKTYFNALTSIILISPNINFSKLSMRLRRLDDVIIKCNPEVINNNMNAKVLYSKHREDSSNYSSDSDNNFPNSKKRKIKNENNKKNFQRWKPKDRNKNHIPPPPLQLPKEINESVQCQRCGKQNHISEECTLSWNKVREIREKKKPRTVTFSEEEKDNNYEFAYMITDDDSSKVYTQGYGILDSGATIHVAPYYKFKYQNIRELFPPLQITTTNSIMECNYIADYGVLKDVYLSSQAKEFLISVKQLCNNKYYQL